jgi:hypothetical protein
MDFQLIKFFGEFYTIISVSVDYTKSNIQDKNHLKLTKNDIYHTR